MIKHKQTTVFWGLAIIVFISVTVGAVIFLSGKSQQDSSDHGTHITSDLEKLNSWIGKEAPNFTLSSYDGQKISLNGYRGKKVVLFFTEGVMCYPACWNQIAALGKDEAFKGEDTVVLNIVVDTKNEWDKAVKKMPELGLVTILHDSSKNVSRQYGVLSLPSSMHKGQFPGHTYLILDKDGIVRYVFDDPKMAVRNEELKAELAKLN